MDLTDLGINLSLKLTMAGVTGSVIIEWVLLILLTVCALTLCTSRHLPNAITALVLYGAIMAALLGFLGADDLAMAEAAVGSGVTGVMLLLALRRLQQHDRKKNS